MSATTAFDNRGRCTIVAALRDPSGVLESAGDDAAIAFGGALRRGGMSESRIRREGRNAAGSLNDGGNPAISSAGSAGGRGIEFGYSAGVITTLFSLARRTTCDPREPSDG